uniref:Uncharacterized protein n=1 Tax=viral metagenome TaxID=1070528 RepID=A0A6C0J009_9ZZZZ
MPSSKNIDKSNDYIPETFLVPKLQTNKHVVSFDQWCDHNEEHLLNIYTNLQEACRSTGRHVFDSETCSFESFCKIAYDNSYKYKKHDINYEPEEYTDDTVAFYKEN